MKLAVITITYNDDFKFKEWFDWYTEYKLEIDYHLIIDNGSNPEYLQKVKEYFVDSEIIELGHNGGCTEAYNVGIKKAMSIADVEYISLIGNDIRIPQGQFTRWVEFMNKHRDIYMSYPLVFQKDSTGNECDNFGYEINYNTMGMRMFKMDEKNYLNWDEFRVCECGLGGINMARKEYYMKVGLQDENLFMYHDEVDMGLRAKDKGLTLATISTIQVWHMHINPLRKTFKTPVANYYQMRNHIYLLKKYKVKGRFLDIFRTVLSCFSIFKKKEMLLKERMVEFFYCLKACRDGIMGKMGIIK